MNIPETRCDAMGLGYFGAKRGSRSHNGIDLVHAVNDVVLAFRDGVVTKLGYPYADDLSYRYVEVTDDFKHRARYFYVDPSVEVGDEVNAGQVIGFCQDIAARYNESDMVDHEKMQNHVHFEIKFGTTYLNSMIYIAES